MAKNNTASAARRAVVGTFDGFHRGHAALLAQARPDVAVTFATHPSALLAPPGVRLLTPDGERLARLRAAVPRVEVLDFDAQTRAMTALEFMRLLKETFDIRTLVLGWDTRFGCDMPADPTAYAALGRQAGIDVETAGRLDGVSSSAVRDALDACRPRDAARMLGRPYGLEGTVVAGRRLGRTLGFPTANLRPIEERQLVPAPGVYATTAFVGARQMPAVTNIGCRPTIEAGDAPLSIETHIPGFDGHLYGQQLRLAFVDFLREERRMASLDELKKQIRTDILAMRRIRPCACS